jgi:hypothetical protein
MPLYGVDKNGRLFEESSVTGKPKKSNIPFADESNVMLGEMSGRQIRARKIAQKKAQAVKLRAKKLQEKKKKIQQRKRLLAAKKKNRAIQKRKIVSQVKAKTTSKKFLRGRRQDMLGYEYSSVHGSPYDGFELEGQAVSSTECYGSDIPSVESFGASTMLGEHDEGLGLRIKRPKLTIKKPTIKAPTTLKAVVKDIGKVTVKAVTAPVKLSTNLVKVTPGLRDVYKGVDKLTGGTLSSVNRVVVDLPRKIAAGKPVSKAELMEAAMVGLKAGAIIMSGGSAASLVSVGAGMLKAGPLGQSSLGRNLLTLAEVAGAAAAIHQAAASKAAAKTAQAGSKQLAQKAAQSTTKEVAKKTIQESAQEAVKAKSLDMAKQRALSEVQKKTGIPAGVLVAAYDVNQTNAALADKAQMFTKKIGEDRLKQAGVGGSMTQAIISGNAEALGVMVKNAPDLAMTKAKREIEAQKVRIMNQASLDNMKARLDKKVAKAQKDATDIEKLKDRIDKEANKLVQKELNNQLAKLMASNAKTTEEIVTEGSEYNLEAARSALKIAAAEEGRYTSDMENRFSHPMLKINRKLTGKA